MKDANKETAETLYAFGYIQRFLEDFAHSSNIPQEQLTIRVGGLLLSKAGGDALRFVDSVPSLRGKTTKNNQTIRKVAVVGRTHRKASRKGMSPEAKQRISDARKKWWASLTPSRRKQVSKAAADARHKQK